MKRIISLIMAVVCVLSFSLSATADGSAALCSANSIRNPVTVLEADAFSFSAAKGTYSAPFYLTITAPKNAKVYYTTNGKTPTTKSTKYSSPILISKTTTVKALYVLNGKKSSVKSVKYTMKASAPVSNVASGVYGDSVCVELTASSGAAIYYTTDGTTPTKSSTKYTDPILIEESCELRAVAYKSGCSKSDVTYESYVILTGSAADDGSYAYDGGSSLSVTDAAGDSDYWSGYWNEYWFNYWYDLLCGSFWGDSDSDPSGWGTYPDYFGNSDSGSSSSDTSNTSNSGATSTDGSATTVSYQWNDGTNSWTWELEIPDDIYNYAVTHKNMARDRVNYDYEKYVTDTYDDEFMKDVADSFRSAAESAGYDESQLLNMVITFVQSLDYVSDYEAKGMAEYPKYPAETLYDKSGDCEDTSALMTSLFKALGYDSCLFIFDDHMASGIAPKSDSNFSGTYFSYNGKKYYFVETTSIGWGIGEYSVNYNSAEIAAA
jgi:predicted transglutaminase-like cysteine proteinase